MSIRSSSSSKMDVAPPVPPAEEGFVDSDEEDEGSPEEGEEGDEDEEEEIDEDGDEDEDEDEEGEGSDDGKDDDLLEDEKDEPDDILDVDELPTQEVIEKRDPSLMPGVGPTPGTPKKKEVITSLWPEFEDKFRPADVERIVETVVREHLEGQPYDGEMPKLIKVLTDAVQAKIKALKYKRYKIITHIALGERRGEGVTSVTRCIWDPMSDCMATYTFLSETVFCCVTVYGIYFY